METGTTRADDKLVSCQPETKPEHELWIVDQLTILAEVMGESSERISPQRLEIYAKDLVDLDQVRLTVAFTRARRELRFFPKIAELRELAGASNEKEQQAEALVAWGVLEEYVYRYVDCDVYGNFGPEHGSHNAPKLADRVVDSVRITGGWRVYKHLTDDDFPFQRQRFMEAYLAWDAMKHVDFDRLYAPEPVKTFLEAGCNRVLPQPHEVVLNPKESSPIRSTLVKRIPEPLSDVQIRDRREMLRQQAVLIQQQREDNARDFNVSAFDPKVDEELIGSGVIGVCSKAGGTRRGTSGRV